MHRFLTFPILLPILLGIGLLCLQPRSRRVRSSYIMAAVLVPVSVAAAVFVMPGVIAELSWISVYEFTLLPLWVLLPVILILSVAVPLACLNRVTRGTLQERLRTAE